MRMITPNKKTKKGFSLIEMLVVIAIIAVLVSIIIPVVHHNTVKAAAATNAANLRAIEGKLKIMRLENPEAFLTVLNLINDNEAVSEVVSIFGWLNDLWNGTGSTETSMNKLYGEFPVENGVLDINRPGNVYIEGVPAAQAVKVTGSKKFDSVNVEKGTEMVIHITDGDLKATYGGYGVNHFADIAEDGKLNESTIENPGNASNALQCLLGHDFGPDGICRRCGYDSGYHACVDEYTVIQNIFNPDNPIKYGGADGKCDICGLEMHTTHVDNDNDHFCDHNDGIRVTECDEEGTYDKEYHYCSVCGENKQPHRFSGGSCVACGRPEHVAPEDCVDTQGQDHACDICGTDGITECSDGPDDYHDCDKCGAPDQSDCADTNPKDHFCDQNCGQTFGTCTLGGSYIQFTESSKYYHTTCEYCKEDKDACADNGKEYGSDNAHKCDVCLKVISNCTKDSEKCDVCGQGEDSGCVTPGTLITMADGTQKPVEDLNVGDMLLVFNHITGKLEAAPLIFNTHSGDAYDYYDVLHLQFSNGTEVEIVQSHGFFDTTMMKYVYITYDNYTDFIGHKFYSDNGEVTLTEAFIEEEYTAIYCPVTYFHMNSFANGMLNTPNIPGDITGLVNYFEYDADLKYNEEAMQRDIEQYGLYTYADFSDYISEAAYNSSPAVHLKVAVGKGMITFEQILAVIEYLLAGSLID